MHSKETNYFQGKVLPLLKTALLTPSSPVSGMPNGPGCRSLPKGNFTTLCILATTLRTLLQFQTSPSDCHTGLHPNLFSSGRAWPPQSGQPPASTERAVPSQLGTPAHPDSFHFCMMLPLGYKHPAQVLEGKINELAPAMTTVIPASTHSLDERFQMNKERGAER